VCEISFRPSPTPYLTRPELKCPICGKGIKNFDAHVRNKDDHKEFKELQQKYLREYCEKYGWENISSFNYPAWVEAVKQLGKLSIEIVEEEEKQPTHTIKFGETMCPKTNEKARKENCITCLDCAVMGNPSYPVFWICLELRKRDD